MRGNRHWTSRTVGEIEKRHFGLKVNPGALKRDDVNGVLLHPKYIYKALRRYLRVGNRVETQKFRSYNTVHLLRVASPHERGGPHLGPAG